MAGAACFFCCQQWARVGRATDTTMVPLVVLHLDVPINCEVAWDHTLGFYLFFKHKILVFFQYKNIQSIANNGKDY